MKNQPIALPSDFYQATTDLGVEYHQLNQQGAEARIKRMDLTYAAYLEELPKGKRGVQERVALRLSLDTGTKSSRVVIGDAIRVFEAFRLTGEQGLGFAREELVSVPWSRLRVVSQNKDWALQHRSEIRDVLQRPEEGEDGILAYIYSTLSPEERAKKEKAKKNKASDDGFESRDLRLTAEDAQAFDLLLQAVRTKAELGGASFSKDEAVARGQLVSWALTEWLSTPVPVYGQDGQPQMEGGQLVLEDNYRFLPETDAQAAD